MSFIKKFRPFIVINILLFIIFVVLNGTCGISLKISAAEPVLPLVLLISVAMFSSEFPAVFTGIVFGAFIDSGSALPFGFNTVFMAIIALAVSLITRHLFNNNIRSAIALSLMISVLYFVLRWLIGYSSSDLYNSLGYILQHGIPSAIYTTVFIIPFYYLQKFISDRSAR